ncbi:helix-turn-helix domain-containing protein [Streptomyces sp. NPDC055607]
MDKDEQFAELMDKSSLGTPQARRITQRVTPEHAETVRRIAHLRNEIVHGYARDRLAAARELVDLLRSLGFAWREEVPDELVNLALNHPAELLASDHAPEQADPLGEEQSWWVVSSAEPTLSPKQPQSPDSSDPDGDEDDVTGRETLEHPTTAARPGATAGQRRRKESKFLSADEAARVMGVSRTKVYRLVRQRVLPSTGAGSNLRIPRSAVHNYMQKSHTGHKDAD